MARRQREFNGKIFSDDGSGRLYNAELKKYLIYRPYPLLVDEVNEADKIEPDNKQEYTSKQLKDKFGTDNTSVINAGKDEKERVSKVEDKETYEEKVARLERATNLYLDGDIEYSELVNDYFEGNNEGADEYIRDLKEDKVAKVEDKKVEKTIQADKVWDDDFTQKSTNPLYSDTNYTKEEINKMSDNGVKPLEESYSGRGWEGKKYDSNLSTKEIAKNISDYAKKEFPGVKISRHTDYDAIDFTITSSDKDIYIDEKGIDKMSDEGVLDLLRNGQNVFFHRWAEDNVPGYKERSTFETTDVRRYIKEDLQRIKNRPNQYVSGNEYYLSDYGKNVISKLNKEMNSYNYDDSDAMTDYFDTNFYGRVNIGSYEKPYKYEEK